jgi:hypothetical protein
MGAGQLVTHPFYRGQVLSMIIKNSLWFKENLL